VCACIYGWCSCMHVCIYYFILLSAYAIIQYKILWSFCESVVEWNIQNQVVTFFWVLDNAKGYGVSAIIPITLVLPLSNWMYSVRVGVTSKKVIVYDFVAFTLQVYKFNKVISNQTRVCMHLPTNQTFRSSYNINLVSDMPWFNIDNYALF
jgi:hypothetical protein